ncbi:MAG: helix-turn-helix domain-containing protein [Hydrogenophaga sp.]|uniref:AraC-like ligand-binding domain-containing protein n=1 Tax=Hydrogenophaga sp. TaxID=1904254 RepID=UPI0025BC10F5|nr:helix-turn-helix domain-containing protein [Hydrogenophaga sp.]
MEPIATSPGVVTSSMGAASSLSTTTVPQSERTAYWLDMICAMYVHLDCDGPDEQELFGDISFNRLGSLDLTQLRSNAQRIRRTEAKIRQGGEDCLLIQIQREGRCLVRQDGRQAVVSPGDFVLYDSSRPYELNFQDRHHDVFVMRLARAQFKVHISNLEELTAMTVSSQDAAGHLLLSMVETLRRDIAKLQPSSALGVSEAITSIVAAGLRGLPGANVRKLSNLHAYHLARIRAYVRDHLRDPELSVQSIALALQISSDHLSRVFRSEPIPLSRWIWKMRLDAIRRDLANPRLREQSVSDIAFSWGFNNAAHFSRSFRDEYQMTPREWREVSMRMA